MECKYCGFTCVKYGKTKCGMQRNKCKDCGKIQLWEYRYKAYDLKLNNRVIVLLKEGVGISSMSRILEISATTVISRIKKIAKTMVVEPILKMRKTYQVDELKTYVGKKKNEIWVAYAYCEQSKDVVSLSVGKRNNKTLKKVTDTLLLSEAKKIKTDKLLNYRGLVPKSIHVIKNNAINHIERMNLNLRTHLKRLGRKTICYSKSTAMLKACLRIYFWSNTSDGG